MTNQRGIAHITASGGMKRLSIANKNPKTVTNGSRGTIKIFETGVISEKLLKLEINSGNVVTCAAKVMASVSRSKNLSGMKLNRRVNIGVKKISPRTARKDNWKPRSQRSEKGFNTSIITAANKVKLNAL